MRNLQLRLIFNLHKFHCFLISNLTGRLCIIKKEFIHRHTGQLLKNELTKENIYKGNRLLTGDSS